MAINKIIFTDGGLNEMFQKALEAAPEKATQAITDIVLDLAGKTVPKTPIESGELRNAIKGKVHETVVFEKQAPTGAKPPPANKIVGEVALRGLPYIIRQHEDLTLRHDRTDGRRTPEINVRTGEPNKTAGRSVNRVAGGEAKFLENAFNENIDRYMKIFEDVIEGVFE